MKYIILNKETERPFLEGKIAIVTGASGDIGFGISEALLDNGAFIYAHYNTNEKRINELSEKHKGKVRGFQLDFLSDNLAQETKKLFREIYQTHKRLDILVNAGGIWDIMRTMDETEEWREKVMKVNYKGPYTLSTIAFRYMIGQPKIKHIVNICSIAGVRGIALQASYSASKGALRNLTQALGEEGANYGINVNTISPGFVDTKLLNRSFPDKKARKLLSKSIPKYKLAEVEDIVNVVLGILMNDYLTGADIPLHGGRA